MFAKKKYIWYKGILKATQIKILELVVQIGTNYGTINGAGKM